MQDLEQGKFLLSGEPSELRLQALKSQSAAHFKEIRKKVDLFYRFSVIKKKRREK